MAAAALASDYLNEAAYWDVPDIDWATLYPVVAQDSGTNSAGTLAHICNLATRSPIALAFMVAGDTDHIYVGHNPTQFPNNPTSASAYDNSLVLLVGDNLQTATPICLGVNHFARTPETHCETHTQLVAGWTNAPPVYRSGPHAAGTGNTGPVRTRPAFTLPTDRASDFIQGSADGRYTLQGFYMRFIEPEITAGGDRANNVEPLRDWWRLSCTDRNAPNAPYHCLQVVQALLPPDHAALQAWASRVRNNILTKMGVGGPGLTNAAFNLGITQIRDAITDTSAAHLTFERDRDNKTFTDRYGESVAQMMYNLCGCADDNGLPEVHRVLAAAPKGRAYAVLEGFMQERALTSTVPLNCGNFPIATTKFTDSVFRSFKPAGTGLAFGEGLSPFSMVCEGHTEAASLLKQLKKAQYVESGTSVSMADADFLTSSDVRFPTTPQAAAEKLYAWSVAIDLFHGGNHPIARTVRAFAIDVGPALHSVFSAAGTPSIGMDLVCRVLFEAQQDYFRWATLTARTNNPADRPVAPAFQKAKEAAVSFRADSLSRMPAPWYLLLDPPTEDRSNRRSDRQRPSDQGTRQQANATSVFNANADRNLLRRFRDSEFTNITAMMEGRNVEIPKHAGSDVCLTWALKGECSAACRRKNQHTRYSQATNRAIGQLLTGCGVPELQE